jgi:hypothetical protein
MSATEIIRDDRPKAESATVGNGRLRKGRREVWRAAEAATRYWRVRLEFEWAVSWAQRMEIPEGGFHPAVDPDGRFPMVQKWRAALVRQLAHSRVGCRFGQVEAETLVRGQHRYIGVKSEQIERAIAKDLAFLAVHPTRRSNSETMARRREFKEAMRQRIRDVAASRDLSDEEIRPVLNSSIARSQSSPRSTA